MRLELTTLLLCCFLVSIARADVRDETLTGSRAEGLLNTMASRRGLRVASAAHESDALDQKTNIHDRGGYTDDTDEEDEEDADELVGTYDRRKRSCPASDTFLEVIKEIPFVNLFHDRLGVTKFEASGTCLAKGYAWVVFDSNRYIGRVDLQLKANDKDSRLIPEKGEEDADSQFEGLAYSSSTDTFIAVRETFEAEGRLLSRTEVGTEGALDPLSSEMRFSSDMSSYSIVRECLVHFELDNVNKGFEGIYYFEEHGKRYFMGLCESNFCLTNKGKGAKGNQPGNGRIVLAEMFEATGHQGCTWEVVKVIQLPKSAFFIDYSAMAFHGHKGSTIAITSQEDAAVWVGKFDWDRKEFKGEGSVLHFPRDNRCKKIYCNVEGIQFVNPDGSGTRVVVTSDKAKSKQPSSCTHKDQSIAIMDFPAHFFKDQEAEAYGAQVRTMSVGI